jgi:hypothetical protein
MMDQQILKKASLPDLASQPLRPLPNNTKDHDFYPIDNSDLRRCCGEYPPCCNSGVNRPWDPKDDGRLGDEAIGGSE